MCRPKQEQGFTLVELLVVVGVLAILIVLVVPAIQRSREAARRSSCISHLMQIGLAMQNFHSEYNRFPASSEWLDRNAEPKTYGFSWLTYLLPYVEMQSVFDSLDIKGEASPANKDPHTNPVAQQTRVATYLCPSYRGAPFVQPTSNPPTGALTNYKAMGATTLASLALAADPTAPPPYGKADQHPDGALFPGMRGPRVSYSDGSSSTLIACETIEPVNATWAEGRYATLVGLPSDVSFVQYTSAGTFYAPAGFVLGQYEGNANYGNKTTYLDYDYRAQPYDSTRDALSGQVTQYGPSSPHPGVVNHLFGDNSVRSVSTKCDLALYMFVITRNGGDPSSEFFRLY